MPNTLTFDANISMVTWVGFPSLPFSGDKHLSVDPCATHSVVSGVYPLWTPTSLYRQLQHIIPWDNVYSYTPWIYPWDNIFCYTTWEYIRKYHPFGSYLLIHTLGIYREISPLGIIFTNTLPGNISGSIITWDNIYWEYIFTGNISENIIPLDDIWSKGDVGWK